MNRAPSLEFSSYVGVPYVDHGRDPAGWDCYGLVYWISRRVLHRMVPSYAEKYNDAECCADVAQLVREQTKWGWREVPFVERAFGDSLVIAMGGDPIHCGLIADDYRMLHCMRGRDTVIETYNGATWRRRVVGVFRWM